MAAGALERSDIVFLKRAIAATFENFVKPATMHCPRGLKQFRMQRQDCHGGVDLG